MVELAGVVADIHQRDNQVEAAIQVKIIADKLRPAIALSLRTLCKAVPGQVDEVHTVCLEEVHICRFARGARHLDEIATIENLVHDRRLAHVRATHEAHLGAGRRRNLRSLAV